MSLSNKEMVETQVIGRGITDEKVVNAMLKIDRKNFVIKDNMNSCYEDRPLSIGYNQTISQPYIVALMTKYLDVNSENKILEIGTGSGYQTALLSEMADTVFTIERIKELYDFAGKNFKKAGIINIKQFLNDGTLGLKDYAPFDRIIVTAAAPSVPITYFNQLKPGGKLIMPVGERYSQDLKIYTVDSEHNPELKKNIPGCVFVPLKGELGW